MKIFYHFTMLSLLCLTLFSCAKNQYVLHDSEIIEYRSSIASIKSGNDKDDDKTDEKNLPSYRQIYSLWITEHAILEQKIESQRLLSILESHRKIQKHLDQMHMFLSPLKSQTLRGYQKLYDNLLADVKKGVSLRILHPRYKHLKASIQENF